MLLLKVLPIARIFLLASYQNLYFLNWKSGFDEIFVLLPGSLSVERCDFWEIKAQSEKRALKDWTRKYIIVHTISIYVEEFVRTCFDIV